MKVLTLLATGVCIFSSKRMKWNFHKLFKIIILTKCNVFSRKFHSSVFDTVVLIITYSVGIPYKEAVMEFCDEVHPLAQVDIITLVLLVMKIGTVYEFILTC